MNLDSIIDQLAGEADDLLSDASNRKEAKTLLAEAITVRFPKIGGVDRQKVIDGVIAILEDEDFFKRSGSRDSWDDGEDGEDSE